MTRKGLLLRAGVGLGLALLVNLVLSVISQRHAVVVVTLIVLCLVAVAWAVTDLTRGAAPAVWRIEEGPEQAPPPTEVTLAGYQRLLTANRSAREVDDRLQSRILSLASDRLRQTRGLSLDSDSPEVRTLLGPDLLRLRVQPPRRLTDEEIRRIIERIEEM